VQASCAPCEHQLRADAVRRGGEEAVAVERVQPGKAAETLRAGGLGRRAQALDDRDGGGE
jgi:hypothetical protein